MQGPTGTRLILAGRGIRVLALGSVCLVIFTGTVLGTEEDRTPSAFESEESTTEKPLLLSPPTLPFPPKVLPALYEEPIFMEVDLLERSLDDTFASCGNGAIDSGEQCDDGNEEPGDGCSALCKLEDITGCGNGRIDSGERCDDGDTFDSDGCSSTCQVESICGDHILHIGEECDDGNTASGDGCSARCRLESLQTCGNSRLDPGEQCDDGNRSDGDGCSATCQLNVVCGDGRVAPGEECDDGNNSDGDSCSALCRVEVPEEKDIRCAEGFILEDRKCIEVKRDAAVCGNSIVEEDEACDDGNTVAGDGCSPVCQMEEDDCVKGGEAISHKVISGTPTTQPAGCDAVCSIRIGYDCKGQEVSRMYLSGESRITGGEYVIEGKEYLCVNGQPAGDSPTGQYNASETTQRREAATVIACN